MPRIKLTKSAIDALPTPSSDVVCWDAAYPGFGVKITPKGRKVFSRTNTKAPRWIAFSSDDLSFASPAHQTLCLNQLWPQRPQLGEPRRWINCSQSQAVQ